MYALKWEIKLNFRLFNMLFYQSELVIWTVLNSVFFIKYMLVIQRFWVVYYGISHESLVFSRCTREPLGEFAHQLRKYEWQVGHSMIYHEKVFHNYFIPLKIQWPTISTQCMMGRFGVKLSRIQRLFLYSDWLYFLWHGINMGYWPSVRSRWLDIGQVLFLASLWTETESRSINSPKKERGQYPAILTEPAWSIKDLLYGFRGNISCGTRRVVPSGQDSSILPARVANHSAGFDSSCPLAELAI